MLIRGTRVYWGKRLEAVLVSVFLSPTTGLVPSFVEGRATNKPMTSSPHYLPYTSGI